MGIYQVATSAAAILLASAISWIAATALERHKKYREIEKRFEHEHKMLMAGMRVIMKSEIFNLHESYVQCGKPVPLDIKEHADNVHAVYAGLGGNGVGTHLWQELMNAHASDSKHIEMKNNND